MLPTLANVMLANPEYVQVELRLQAAEVPFECVRLTAKTFLDVAGDV